MSPFIPILAGVLANKLSADDGEEEAKKQAIMQMRMQYAQRLSPDMPTYGLQAAQLQQKLAQERDEGQRKMLAALVPAAISGIDKLSADDAGTGEEWSKWSTGLNKRLSDQFNAQNDARLGVIPVPIKNGAYQVNPLRGLDGSEDW